MKRTNHCLLLGLQLLLITLAGLTSGLAQITPSQDSYTNTATSTAKLRHGCHARCGQFGGVDPNHLH